MFNETFKSTLASGELGKRIIHIGYLLGSISISIGKTDLANHRGCASYLPVPITMQLELDSSCGSDLIKLF